MKLRLLTVLLLFAVALPSPAEEPGSTPQESQPTKKKSQKKDAETQKGGEEEEEGEALAAGGGVKFAMKKHPTLYLGKLGTVTFRAKFQADFRGYDPALSTLDGCGAFADSNGCLFEIHRARASLKGTVLKYFDFEVEREFKDTSRLFVREITLNKLYEVEEITNPWRDVYVDFRRFRKFQIQAGKFKVPFSLDQLSGDSDLDFIYRSRLGDSLAPGREIGIMAHGRFFKRALNYQLGLFKHDGDNARLSGSPAKELEETATGQGTIAGRLSGTPLRLAPLPNALRKIEFGGAFTSSPVPDGVKGLRGRTTSKESFFPHMPVAGRRNRLGTEANWVSGPFTVKGEFVRVQEQRIKQSLLGKDLPDLLTHAWYLSGSWLLTGEEKGKLDPNRPFRKWLFWGGPGAVELAARYEQLRFSSADQTGRPSRTPRAVNVLQNSDRVWTIGVNWYLNHWVKIQANAIWEKLEDPVFPTRVPVEGRDRYRTQLIRIQFAM